MDCYRAHVIFRGVTLNDSCHCHTVTVTLSLSLSLTNHSLNLSSISCHHHHATAITATDAHLSPPHARHWTRVSERHFTAALASAAPHTAPEHVPRGIRPGGRERLVPRSGVPPRASLGTRGPAETVFAAHWGTRRECSCSGERSVTRPGSRSCPPTRSPSQTVDWPSESSGRLCRTTPAALIGCRRSERVLIGCECCAVELI